MSNQTQTFLAATTGGYSCMTSTPVSGKTYKKLLIFFPGSGEVGDGSPAQLPAVAIHGPLAPYAAGVTWFDDNGVIVAAIQPPATINYGTAQTTVKWLQSHFGITNANTYLTGLSLGGGVAMTYVNRLGGGFAGVLAIEPASYGPATQANWAGTKVTVFTNWDDTTAASPWSLGVPDGGAVTFVDANGKNLGWLQSIYGTSPLDTHPDHPTAIAHSGSPKLTAITAQRTGVWVNNGWVWDNGTDFATTTTARAIFSPTGGHGGWDAIYGVDASTFQPTIMSVFLDVADVTSQLAAAQTALATATAALATANAALSASQAALAAEKSAHAADVATLTTTTAQLSQAQTDLANAESSLSATTGQLAQSQNDLAAANAALASVNLQLTNANAATAAATAATTAAVAATTQAQSDLAAANADKATLQATVDGLTAAATDTATKLAAAVAAVDAAVSSITSLTTQIGGAGAAISAAVHGVTGN